VVAEDLGFGCALPLVLVMVLALPLPFHFWPSLPTPGVISAMLVLSVMMEQQSS
jgi:hypothetical protein